MMYAVRFGIVKAISMRFSYLEPAGTSFRWVMLDTVKVALVTLNLNQ